MSRVQPAGWGSARAESLYRIGVTIAGFDPVELMRQITRLQRGRTTHQVSAPTVERAMQQIAEEQAP